MVMSPEEIIRDYRTAKSPRSQIGILADLNDCSKAEIARVLIEAGEQVPKYYTKASTGSDEASSARPDGAGEGSRSTDPSPDAGDASSAEPACLPACLPAAEGGGSMRLEDLWELCDDLGAAGDILITVEGEQLKSVRVTKTVELDAVTGEKKFCLDMSFEI